MDSSIQLNAVTLDIPIVDISRSFRTTLLNRYIGGRFEKNKKGRVNLRALDNINLHLKTGDRLGLVGHNGAGKTTLLRLMAGLYKPTIGTLAVQGKITPLFNSTVGMEMEDTGLENLFNVGMYLGLSKKEMENKQEDIVAFSELGDFIHLPVRTYSSGMLLRLSFAIATTLEPNILLMDEGIGAGDASFTEKAKRRLESFYSKLNILVIASHSDTLVKEMCNKAILLEHGKITAQGAVDDVLAQYHANIKAAAAA